MVILRSSEHLKECLVLQTNAKHPSEIVPSVLKVTSIWVGQVNRLPRSFAAQEGWCGVLLCQTHLGKRIHFQYNFSSLLDPWISKLDPSQWWALCTQLALVSFSLMGVSTCSPCSWCFPAWNKVPLALQPCSRMINLLNPTLHPTQSFPWLPLYNVTQRQESFAGQCQPGRARDRDTSSGKWGGTAHHAANHLLFSPHFILGHLKIHLASVAQSPRRRMEKLTMAKKGVNQHRTAKSQQVPFHPRFLHSLT